MRSPWSSREFTEVIGTLPLLCIVLLGAAPAPPPAPARLPAGAKDGTPSSRGGIGAPSKEGERPSAAKPDSPTAKADPKTTRASGPAFEPNDPSTWKLHAKLAPGSAARARLVHEWTAPATLPGEAALTAKEAETLLDDPRAELIYGERTLSIVAPSMIQRERKDHLDLLALFLKPERVDAGVRFVREHAAMLDKVEKAHKVDRHVVVSILMWESRLGTVTGEYVAFNAFSSQAFYIEEASGLAMANKEERKLTTAARQAERVAIIRDRAHKNLTALVRQCKARGIDPLTVKGSWAGALGYPQFMPASLRWAEDGDGDGKIDLFTFDDSIASIARYLEAHGFAKSASKAVWDYNHEDAYVKGVLTYATALKDGLAKLMPDAGPPTPSNAAPVEASDAKAGGETRPASETSPVPEKRP